MAQLSKFGTRFPRMMACGKRPNSFVTVTSPFQNPLVGYVSSCWNPMGVGFPSSTVAVAVTRRRTPRPNRYGAVRPQTEIPFIEHLSTSAASHHMVSISPRWVDHAACQTTTLNVSKGTQWSSSRRTGCVPRAYALPTCETVPKWGGTTSYC